jgi:hypothetical protein
MSTIFLKNSSGHPGSVETIYIHMQEKIFRVDTGANTTIAS